MRQEIEIIPSHKIDKLKWDACICNSSNALIYATSLYLDSMADHWHGIVINDYSAVMPVPWRKKYGIRYTYQVPFIQQLGWFQQQPANDHPALLKALFSFIKYGDYAFNFQNKTSIENATVCSNYIINLSGQYSTIKENYSTDLLNNLKKAGKENLVFSAEDHNTAIDLFKQLYQSRTPHVTAQDYENFRSLCTKLSGQGNVLARKVSAANGELLAVALLLKDERRIYNMMNSTTEKGRKTEANHFLFDRIFEEFVGCNLLFDFEGSDIPGVKNFYEKFGSINQPYCSLHFNRLPFPLNILKR